MAEITLTLKEAIEVNTALQALGEVKIPTRQSYRVSKLLRKLDPEMKQFHETQVELFKKHGAEENEDGKSWKFENNPEGLKACQEELKELLEEEVKLVGVARLVIEELEAKDVDIEPNILMLADPVITESE